MKIYYKANNPQAAMSAYLLGKELECENLIAKARNSDINSKTVIGEPIIFVGYAPKLDLIKSLITRVSSLTIYVSDDINVKEIRDYARTPEIGVPLFINKFEGCLLEAIWERLRPHSEPPAQVKVVIDNYYRKENQTEANAFAFWHALGFSAETAKTFLEEPLYSADLKGAIIFKYRENFANKILKRAFTIDWMNSKVVVLSIPGELVGELLPLLKLKYPQADFFMFTQVTSKGVKCRVRSNKDFDVQPIVRAFKGQGTTQSGIFTLDWDFASLAS